ncbi:MAG: indole-3-glycerol phosphate synthase TrpC [Pseudomonadota bacterium]
MSILDDIIAYKRAEVAQAKNEAPIGALEALAADYAPRGFRKALEGRAANGAFALIAEIKKASPSKGMIRQDFEPAAHARDYEKGGAACLSVLTDGPSFKGSPAFLKAAREATRLPILRKDFMIDPYQVVEARAWGADCILIILACTSDPLAAELSESARDQKLDVLVEVHDADEMARAQRLGATLIGVNNRNLKTFETNLKVTRELAATAPEDALLVAESGIERHADLQELASYGAKAFLIGESLMRQPDLVTATQALLTPVKLA